MLSIGRSLRRVGPLCRRYYSTDTHELKHQMEMNHAAITKSIDMFAASIGAKLDATESKIATLSTSVTDKFSTVNEKFSTMNGKFDTVNEKFSTVNAKIDSQVIKIGLGGTILGAVFYAIMAYFRLFPFLADKETLTTRQVHDK